MEESAGMTVARPAGRASAAQAARQNRKQRPPGRPGPRMADGQLRSLPAFEGSSGASLGKRRHCRRVEPAPSRGQFHDSRSRRGQDDGVPRIPSRRVPAERDHRPRIDGNAGMVRHGRRLTEPHINRSGATGALGPYSKWAGDFAARSANPVLDTRNGYPRLSAKHRPTGNG